MNLTFILATGRTGTVFLSKVFDKLPDIRCTHERNGRILRILYDVEYRGYGHSFFRRLALYLISNDIDLDEKKHIIEINNQIKYNIPQVFEKFPSSNYIHITRDPRDHVVSGVNWTMDKPLNRWMKLNFPFWSPEPKKSNLNSTDIDRLFAITVTNWKESNREYLKLKNATKKYNHLKFEDLKTNTVGFVKNVLSVSGYEKEVSEDLIKERVVKTKRNSSSFEGIGKWEKWPDKYILYIEENCGDLMREFGYGNEPKWIERVRMANDKKRK